jgi:hypothetical protein
LGHIALGRADFVLAIVLAAVIAIAVAVDLGPICSRVMDPMQT